MDDPASKKILSGYAYFLAEHQFLDKDIAMTALEHANKNNQSYIEYLIKQKLLGEAQIAKATSEYFGLPLCDIGAFDVDLVPLEYLNIQLVKKRLALPLFKKSNLIYMAVFDPTIENLYEIRFLTGFDLRLIIVELTPLEAVIDRLLNTLILSEIDETSDASLKGIEVKAVQEEQVDLALLEAESAPIVNFVNRVLLDAIQKKASDIHFEHYEDTYRIRFRQHGILYPITAPSIKLANYILARIKVMSNLDITEHRLPQDGRFKLIISKKRSVDFRVSICPTIFGEKIVLRILDSSQVLQDLKSIGMDATKQALFVNALQRSQGLILVTGPTGSGKSVTLYSALHYLNSPEKNISTVEDPVEIPIVGINQVQVNTQTNFTFSTALRSFLRQDPDIIMVGEIRDLETAEIATKAAQTGHLVLSTLHTNSAPEAVSRLMNMGIEPYNIASSLAIVIAQRLVRSLCDFCKQKEDLTDDILIREGFKKEDIGKLQLYKAVGCTHCSHGFNGRIGIFEVLPITKEMAQLIMDGGNAIAIANLAAQEGVINLRDAGLNVVQQGITSLTELNRVFK